jgi:hypothetical protein
VDIAKAGGWPTERSTSAAPLKVGWAPINTRRANPRNARTHSNRQRRWIAAGLRKFSFLNPVLVDDVNMILVDHGRVERTKLEGFTAFQLSVSIVSPTPESGPMSSLITRLRSKRVGIAKSWRSSLAN